MLRFAFWSAAILSGGVAALTVVVMAAERLSAHEGHLLLALFVFNVANIVVLVALRTGRAVVVLAESVRRAELLRRLHALDRAANVRDEASAPARGTRVVNPLALTAGVLVNGVAVVVYAISVFQREFMRDSDFPLLLAYCFVPPVLSLVTAWLTWKRSPITIIRRRLQEAELRRRLADVQAQLGIAPVPPPLPRALAPAAAMTSEPPRCAVEQPGRKADPTSPRPHSAGGVIVGSVALLARNVGRIVLLVATFSLPALVATAGLATVPAYAEDSLPVSAIRVAAWLFAVGAGIFASSAATFIALRVRAGANWTIWDAFRCAVHRSPAVLLLSAMMTVATMTGLALLVIPGIVLVTALWVAIPAVVAEPELGPVGAFRRSVALTKGARWSALFTIVLVFAATALAQWGVEKLVVLGGHGQVQVVLAPLATLSSAVLGSLAAIAATLSYSQLRSAAESGWSPGAAIAASGCHDGRPTSRELILSGALALAVVGGIGWAFWYARGPDLRSLCDHLASHIEAEGPATGYALWADDGLARDRETYVRSCVAQIERHRTLARGELDRAIHDAFRGQRAPWRAALPAWAESGIDAHCVVRSATLAEAHACSCELTTVMLERGRCERSEHGPLSPAEVLVRFIGYSVAGDLDAAERLALPAARREARAYAASIRSLAESSVLADAPSRRWETPVRLIVKATNVQFWDEACGGSAGLPAGARDRCEFGLDGVPQMSLKLDAAGWQIANVAASPFDTWFAAEIGACVSDVDQRVASGEFPFARAAFTAFQTCAASARSTLSRPASFRQAVSR